MTTIIAASEAKSKFSELLERIGQGEQFAITLHGKEVAKLIPAHRASLEQIQKTISSMELLQSRTVLNRSGQPRLKIKDLVSEGRP